MRPRVELNYEGIGDVMRLPEVRQALDSKATEIAVRARGMSETDGIRASIGTETGTRPKGRSYARAVSDALASEFGTANTARRRTLARAAGL